MRHKSLPRNYGWAGKISIKGTTLKVAVSCELGALVLYRVDGQTEFEETPFTVADAGHQHRRATLLVKQHLLSAGAPNFALGSRRINRNAEKVPQGTP